MLLVALAAQLAIAQSAPSTTATTTTGASHSHNHNHSHSHSHSHSRGEKDSTHSVSPSSAVEHACAALASIADSCAQGKEAMGLWRDPGITSALPLPPPNRSNSGNGGSGSGGNDSNAFDVLFTTLRYHKWSVGVCEQGLRLLVVSTEGLGENQRQVLRYYDTKTLRYSPAEQMAAYTLSDIPSKTPSYTLSATPSNSPSNK